MAWAVDQSELYEVKGVRDRVLKSEPGRDADDESRET
jgi:hypothetical protein